MKVLVTAASKHGSTTEIARVIAGVLRASDVEADVIAPESVATLAGYDAVVLGSGVYAGRWLEPARAFVSRHRVELLERPVFLFSSGPTGEPPKPTQDPADVTALDEVTGAVDHHVFAGRVLRSQLDLFERLVSVMLHPDGDFRPWDDIADWAKEIARFLNREHAAPMAAVSRPVEGVAPAG